MKSRWTLVFVLAGAAACASSQRTGDALSSSVAAARAAQEAGANDVPEAKLHLALANEEIEAAKRYDSEGEEDRSVRMAARAEADADLARAMARAEAARKRAEMATAHVNEHKADLATEPAPEAE